MATATVEPAHLGTDLKTLYLSTVAAQLRPLVERAARTRQAPADYLAQLVHLEVTGRRERRIQRRIKDARFPMLNTLDAFAFDAQPALDRDAVLDVFGCGFVADAANLVVTTHLPFARWSEVFLDPTASAAVIDRIVHHATVLTTAGDSYRLKAATRNQVSPAPQEVPPQ